MSRFTEDEDLCSRCQKKPAYIGTMCQDCHRELSEETRRKLEG